MADFSGVEAVHCNFLNSARIQATGQPGRYLEHSKGRPRRSECYFSFLFASILFAFMRGSLCPLAFAGIEIHGFVTQGFLFSSHNNSLTCDRVLATCSGPTAPSASPIQSLPACQSESSCTRISGDNWVGPSIRVDWASGDYRVNDDFGVDSCARLEAYLLDGTGLGYYASTKPNGLQPNSNLLAAKVGFSF